MFKYEFHPVAEIFPLMEGQAYADLVDDIRQHGLRDAILLADGRIADGRNRYMACIEAKVEPRFESWNGEGSLVALVLSRNTHRRHLDRSQLAIVAAKAVPFFQEEAAKRERSGTLASNEARGKATEKAAESLGASRSSVERAKTVIDKGDPELVAAVESGDVAVSDAAAITDQPKATQRQAVKAVQQGKAKSVKAAVLQAADKEETKPVLDQIGCEVPERILPSYVKHTAHMMEATKFLNAALKEFEASAEGNPHFHLQSTACEIGNAKRAAKFARPYAVCPYCKASGQKCNACKGVGWVGKNIYEAAPRELK